MKARIHLHPIDGYGNRFDDPEFNKMIVRIYHKFFEIDFVPNENMVFELAEFQDKLGLKDSDLDLLYKYENESVNVTLIYIYPDYIQIVLSNGN